MSLLECLEPFEKAHAFLKYAKAWCTTVYYLTLIGIVMFHVWINIFDYLKQKTMEASIAADPSVG